MSLYVWSNFFSSLWIMDHILQLLASLENFNWMPNTFSILNFKLVLACSWLTYWSSWSFCVSVYSKFSFVLLLRHDLSWISSNCKCSTRLIIFWLAGFWKSSRLIWTWKHFRLKLAAHLSRELFSHIVKRAFVQIFGNYCLQSFLFSSTLPTNFSHFYLPYISVLSPEIPTTCTVSDSLSWLYERDRGGSRHSIFLCTNNCFQIFSQDF